MGLLKPPDPQDKINLGIAFQDQIGGWAAVKIFRIGPSRKNIRWRDNLKEKEPRKRIKTDEVSPQEGRASEKTAIDPDLAVRLRSGQVGVDNFVTIVYTLDIMTTVIHIKSDKEVKENAQRAAKELGLTLTDVINAALRNFIKTREVIFSNTPRMTPELEKLIAKVEKDIKKGRNLSPRFESIEEAIDWLNAK